MDHQITKRQIGIGTLMALGARDFVGAENELMFRVGSPRKLSKVIVHLNGDDLYDVRVVSMNSKTYKILIDQTEHGVDCESLSRVVLDLAGHL